MARQVLGLELRCDITEEYENNEDYINAFRSDEGLSLIFIKYFGKNIKIYNSQNDAYIWSDQTNLWEPKNCSFIANILSPLLEEKLTDIKTQIENTLKNISDNDKKKDDLKTKLKIINKEINRVLSTQGSYAIIKKVCPKLEDYKFTKELNNKFIDLLPIKNKSVINLKTGIVSERLKEHYFSFECPVILDNEKSRIDKVDDFMLKICNKDNNLKNFLQVALGYMITGHTSEQCFFIWWGNGSNGKSTLIRILNKILNVFYAPTSKEVFIKNSKGSYSGSSTEYLVPLINSRLAVFSESEKDEMINEGFIKTLTGNESITYRPIYGKQDDFIPYFKLIMQTNNKPIIDTNQHSVLRRIKLLPFLAEFCDNPELPNQFPKDNNLVNEIETECLSAVFTWILTGAKKWYQEGLTFTPDIVKDETKKYLNELDDIGRFLQEMTEIKNNVYTGHRVLYNCYINWAKDEGTTIKTEREFSSILTGVHKFQKKRRAEGMVYLDLILKPT